MLNPIAAAGEGARRGGVRSTEPPQHAVPARRRRKRAAALNTIITIARSPIQKVNKTDAIMTKTQYI